VSGDFTREESWSVNLKAAEKKARRESTSPSGSARRYMTTEQRQNKNCKRHICSRCGATFACKTKCWQHMDCECQKRPNANPPNP
jgi:hypothetical protein